jgi:hypothetical protein
LATETRSLPLPVLTPLRVRELGHYRILGSPLQDATSNLPVTNAPQPLRVLDC